MFRCISETCTVLSYIYHMVKAVNDNQEKSGDIIFGENALHMPT